ncbi:unnamed protein product [Meloidogyne enterolobii]|uniref:Uncharacterized protein n=1 Tax=Meloidogyne enterolobii TaxID=390850 RepID=A0ACB1A729_MELEN
MAIEDLYFMINVFTQYSDYQFKIKLPPGYDLQTYSNIQITDEFIDQQKILFDPNTKFFISHCGQNSLTEVYIFRDSIILYKIINLRQYMQVFP